ncbi:NADH-quinone oxidoreductase subunit NuoF family protein [Mangrovihabitans endophyticus]|uniref:Oxidoreductase n=1 Tax=Mangrovihabitans endophyticus TaxID=1751298 RepID=A0A8J3FQ45_9ACTN|nr:NADH-quinone oxidoreductase subunit NuoF family protein [Mangrovihabitans endophyticus]GGL00545.1 oxidoreductase [Mangrovihabitans endophyticus]
MSANKVPPVTSIGTPRITAGFDEFGRLDLVAHQEVHGGFAALSSGELVGLADRIELRGRGGAGFPFARKVRAVIDSCRRQDLPPVIVVNATEGEPPSWKDKAILTRGPHLILDGAALAAAALDAEEIVIGIADDGIGQASLAAALAERRMPAPTRIVTVPHRFISGEGGALVRGINGEAHIPPGRKVRSSDNGVDGLPTLLSNAETYSQLAIAARLGPWEYNAVGIPEEPGTVMLTVGGSASAPAVVECPTGTPLMDILTMCGADIGPGILVGGYHGKWMTAEAAETVTISRKGFAAAGATLGAGMIIPIGSKTCPIGEVAQVTQYLAGESAGQCGPCRLGLPDLARAVTLVALGGSGLQNVRAAAGVVKGRGACSHPDGTSRFALSALEVFAADVEAHANGEGCGKPVQGLLPLPYHADQGARKLALDWSRCDGHGLCSAVAPEIIRLDANGFPAFPQTPLPPWLENGARKAVNVCPALALRLTEATR